MSTHHKTFNPACHSHIQGLALFKSLALSLLILSPALLAGIYLVENRVPIASSYLLSCIILLLTTLDFATIIMIEPYRRKLSALTLPSFIGAMSVVLLFVITEALNRFFEHMGYAVLTPFVVVSVLLLYVTIFCEKNIALKCLLSLNSVALATLWAMGAIDKVTMPF